MNQAQPMSHSLAHCQLVVYAHLHDSRYMKRYVCNTSHHYDKWHVLNPNTAFVMIDDPVTTTPKFLFTYETMFVHDRQPSRRRYSWYSSHFLRWTHRQVHQMEMTCIDTHRHLQQVVHCSSCREGDVMIIMRTNDCNQMELVVRERWIPSSSLNLNSSEWGGSGSVVCTTNYSRCPTPQGAHLPSTTDNYCWVFAGLLHFTNPSPT